MFERQPHLSALRGLTVAICLTALAGCGADDIAGVTDSAPTGVTPATPATPATPGASATAPAAPTGLSASSGNAQAGVTWTAVSGATSYSVKRSTTNGSGYAQVTTTTAPTYTDSAVSNGTTYYYVVAAVNAAGTSANSAQVSAAPVAPAAGSPPTPTALAATSGNAQASLNWAASSGAVSYVVKRSTTTGGPYTQVATTTSPTYADSTVSNGTTYFYVVSAANSSGSSANSTQISVTPAAQSPPMAVPGVPSGVSANAGNAQVTLNWSASGGAASYNVKRATNNGGPYTQVATATSTSYNNASLANGTTYYYVVSAVNSTGESANSAQISALPVAPVSNPAPSAFGTWINVTPSNVNLSSALTCGNYGTQSVVADPAHPSNFYAQFFCQGVWKSTDYGATWTGPINTGSNGAAAGDCAGGLSISPSSVASVPIIYQACIRGNGTGFWKSVDGGVSWVHYNVAPSGSRQDYYPPVVDPHDQNHLLMAGHEMNYIVESVDGGQTWTNVHLEGGMMSNGGTASIFFIDTGNASTTRGNWMWMGQQAGGANGTWRTTNSGSNWTQVDKNEHTHGAGQIYQPDTNGVVFMAGAYSMHGWGVLRSHDYGQTWTHVGNNSNLTVVVGTSKNIYGMLGFGGGSNFEVAAQPGTGNWVEPGTPPGSNGVAQISVTNDGSRNILVGAMWTAGLWRYIEP